MSMTQDQLTQTDKIIEELTKQGGFFSLLGDSSPNLSEACAFIGPEVRGFVVNQIIQGHPSEQIIDALTVMGKKSEIQFGNDNKAQAQDLYGAMQTYSSMVDDPAYSALDSKTRHDIALSVAVGTDPSIDTLGFQRGTYGKFTENDLGSFDGFKSEGNELFDFDVPGMQEMYDKISSSQKPEAISRDSTSFSEIQDSVRQAVLAHPTGDAIVLLSGAYRHMIGVITELQKDFNIKYIPVDGMKISTEIPDTFEKVTADTLTVQMQRDLGVAKHLGFATMEDVRNAVDNYPHDPEKRTLVIVAFNETGLHGLNVYNETPRKIFPLLQGIILDLETQPAFVSYIGEDLYVDNIRSTVLAEKPDDYPRNAFLQNVHQAGIPVEIGAFGHRDRHNHELGMNVSRMSLSFRDWNGPV